MADTVRVANRREGKSSSETSNGSVLREKALKRKPHERGGVNNTARMHGEQAGRRASLGTTLEPDHSG